MLFVPITVLLRLRSTVVHNTQQFLVTGDERCINLQNSFPIDAMWTVELSL